MGHVTRISSYRDLRTLIEPLHALAGHDPRVHTEVCDMLYLGENAYDFSRVSFLGPSRGHDKMRIGLFAGIHGDEPAGCDALVRFVQELIRAPEIATGYDLVFYPVCNPTGYERNTRENHAGVDLNREFWSASAHGEVRVVERELITQSFDGIISLHADDTCDGVYGYAHGRLLNEALLRPAIAAAEAYLPRDSRCNIDGFTATDAILCDCFKGVLSPPATQVPHPFDLIFETPANAPHNLQVDASIAAIRAILDNYRQFMAYGQNL